MTNKKNPNTEHPALPAVRRLAHELRSDTAPRPFGGLPRG